MAVIGKRPLSAAQRAALDAGRGRPKGVQNKFSMALKDMILTALDMAGGADYLHAQAKKNPGVFLALVGKVLPMSVAGADGMPASPRRVIIELDDARS